MQAARRHRRRQEDRDHPQGHRRHRARRRQAPGAGAGRARQGRYPGRLRADAQCARGRRRLGAGEEVHGGDERRDLDHHHQVALHGAHVASPLPQLNEHARHLGLQERHPQGLHDGLRLRPRATTPRRHSSARSRRRAARSSARCDIPVANPDFSAFVQRAKDSQSGSASTSSCPAARSRRRSGRRSPSAASIRSKTKVLGQGELTDEQALKSMGDAALGIITAVPLRLQPRLRAEQGVREGLQRGLQAQSGLLLGRRLRRHAPDLRGAEEDRRQDRRRRADRAPPRA